MQELQKLVYTNAPKLNTTTVISLHVRPASLTHHFLPGRKFLNNVRPYGRIVLRRDACFLSMCVPSQGSLDSYCSLLSAQQAKGAASLRNRVSLVLLSRSGAHLKPLSTKAVLCYLSLSPNGNVNDKGCAQYHVA